METGRHRQHTSSTSNMLLMIMPKEMHVYLLNGGNDIFNELTRALNASAQLNAEKSVVRTLKQDPHYH